MADTWLKDLLGYHDLYFYDGETTTPLPRRKALRIIGASSVVDNDELKTTDLTLDPGEGGEIPDPDGDVVNTLEDTHVVAVHIGATRAAIGSWSTGELLARTGTNAIAGVRWLLRGAGSPDGSITAPTASLYQNTDDNSYWRNTDGSTAWEQLYFVPDPSEEDDGEVLTVASGAAVWTPAAAATEWSQTTLSTTNPTNHDYDFGSLYPGHPTDGTMLVEVYASYMGEGSEFTAAAVRAIVALYFQSGSIDSVGVTSTPAPEETNSTGTWTFDDASGVLRVSLAEVTGSTMMSTVRLIHAYDQPGT